MSSSNDTDDPSDHLGQRPLKIMFMSHSKIAMYIRELEHTDGLLECNEVLWPIHKVKLTEVSPFFQKAFSRKVNDWKEAMTGRVSLGRRCSTETGTHTQEEDSFAETPESIERILTYVYKPKDFPRMPVKDIATGKSLDHAVSWHLNMLRLLDKFQFEAKEQVQYSWYELNEALKCGQLGSPSSSKILTDASNKTLVTDVSECQLNEPQFANGMLLSTFCAIGYYLANLEKARVNKRARSVWVWVAAANWTILDGYEAFRDCIDGSAVLCRDIVNLCNSKASWRKPLRRMYDKHRGWAVGVPDFPFDPEQE